MLDRAFLIYVKSPHRTRSMCVVRATKPLPMTLMIDSLWLRVHDVWRRSKIAIRPGVSSIDVTAFETRYGVVLPTDVRDYFRAADGTGDL